MIRSWRWVIASLVGLALGLPLGLFLGVHLEIIVGMLLITPVMTAIVGVIVGSSQWLVLRTWLPRSGWWIVASAVGMGAGLTVGTILLEKGGELLTGAPLRMASTGPAGLALAFVILGLIAGFGLGLAQWLFFRRTVRVEWVAVSAGGLAAALLFGFAASLLLFDGVRSGGGLVTFLVCSGLGFGVVTGLRLPEASERGQALT